MQKSHPKMVKPRDKAGECRRREEDWPRSVISFCIMVGVSKTRREQLKKTYRWSWPEDVNNRETKQTADTKNRQRQSTDDRKQELWTWPGTTQLLWQDSPANLRWVVVKRVVGLAWKTMIGGRQHVMAGQVEVRGVMVGGPVTDNRNPEPDQKLTRNHLAPVAPVNRTASLPSLPSPPPPNFGLQGHADA